MVLGGIKAPHISEVKMSFKPDTIVLGQKPDGTYVALKANANGELIVAGSVGGGSGSVQISDGVQTVTITDVAGKKSMDVNVTDIVISHIADSIRIGDGTRLVDVSTIGGKNSLHTTQEKKTYKKLIDEPDANTIFIGLADPGSSASSAVWQIKKIVFSGANISELLANGSDAFDQIWNNRNSLTYI
ncbi:MAG: hypothetical protein IM577_06110, partial [Chitinophagaceae bacterium]|jgi:hypothetical protein|nr:hypothetical protein [Chitinophagaceae bacterium]